MTGASLTIDGGLEITRDITTGKSVVDVTGGMDASTIAALRLALGAQDFVNMDAKDRRTMLFDVAQLSLSADELAKRLVEKGIPPNGPPCSASDSWLTSNQRKGLGSTRRW